MLAADERLLEVVGPDRPAAVRWYVVDQPAVVTGFAQRTRVDDLLDHARCAERGIAILGRRAGGGLVLLDDGMLCLTVVLAAGHRQLDADVTASYRWLGEALAAGLRGLGVAGARRVETAEARADVAALARDPRPTAAWMRAICYGALSPHEVAVGAAKIVGLAQVRRRRGALFQVGILLRDQSPLADLLRLDAGSAAAREDLRQEIGRRTAGLGTHLADVPPAQEIARSLGLALAEATRG